MKIKDIKENIKLIIKLEKSNKVLFNNLEEIKKTNFSMMNMMTFSFAGVGVGVVLNSVMGYIPLMLAMVSGILWAYLANTPANQHANHFEKYIGRKYKKLTSQKKLLEIYKSNLTVEELKFLDEIYSNNIENDKLLFNLIFNESNKEYIKENPNEVLEIIKNIEFENELEEELFINKFTNITGFVFENEENKYEGLKKEINKNNLEKKVVNKNQKMILKNI